MTVALRVNRTRPPAGGCIRSDSNRSSSVFPCSVITPPDSVQLTLMRSVRQSVMERRFPEFVRSFMRRMFSGAEPCPSWAVDALASVGITLDEPWAVAGSVSGPACKCSGFSFYQLMDFTFPGWTSVQMLTSVLFQWPQDFFIIIIKHCVFLNGVLGILFYCRCIYLNSTDLLPFLLHFVCVFVFK